MFRDLRISLRRTFFVPEGRMNLGRSFRACTKPTEQLRPVGTLETGKNQSSLRDAKTIACELQAL